MPQRPVEEIARDLAGRAAYELGLSAAREKRLADALAEALAVERGRADEFERVFTKATGDAAGILWEDDPEATYTAGPDGPGLVALHFKKQRDGAREELTAERARSEELRKALSLVMAQVACGNLVRSRDHRAIEQVPLVTALAKATALLLRDSETPASQAEK